MRPSPQESPSAAVRLPLSEEEQWILRNVNQRRVSWPDTLWPPRQHMDHRQSGIGEEAGTFGMALTIATRHASRLKRRSCHSSKRGYTPLHPVLSCEALSICYGSYSIATHRRRRAGSMAGRSPILQHCSWSRMECSFFRKRQPETLTFFPTTPGVLVCPLRITTTPSLYFVLSGRRFWVNSGPMTIGHETYYENGADTACYQTHRIRRFSPSQDHLGAERARLREC